MNFDLYKKIIRTNYPIDRELFKQFDVKRGLRNSDGSGVLAGLTRVSSVVGYKKTENGIEHVEGNLRYRGIDINQIVDAIIRENRDGFEEVTFLLLFGRLPNKVELADFKELLDENNELPVGFEELIFTSSTSKNVMNKLARSILGLYSFDPKPDSIDISNTVRQSIELIARFSSMLAYCYQAVAHFSGQKSLVIHKSVKNTGIAKNFLRLIRTDAKYTELEARTLDLALVLHAEHGGGNNSSFTTHVVSSSATDIYSAIAAAIGSLKGPKHGGANLRVIGMMNDIMNNVKNWDKESEVADYLIKILNKEAYDKTGLIYGIGHAVYTLSDPRAIILKKYAHQLSIEKNREKEYILYDIVDRLTPKLFQEVKKSNKVVSTNVDFYSGFVYNMLEIPNELYTPIFAMARVVGWCAHRLEELIVGDRIIRPSFKSIEAVKNYISIENR
jgi:citrate synthase